MTPSDKVVLITGASSGIGKACAERLAQRGYRVFGTSRRASLSPDPASPGAVTMVRMDVTDDESVRQGVEFVLSQTGGRLDVVVNNAGFGVAGAVEDTTVDEAKAQLETNFFGMVRVCHEVLPVMREQRSGTIVNISSLGGIIALPYEAYYSAAKFAVEGLSEALRMEVKQFGIHVVLVEPGDTSTQFTANRNFVAAANDDSPYAPAMARMMKIVEADELGGAPPQKVAQALERIVAARSPRPRYMVGPAYQKAAAVLKKILPGRLFEFLLMKYYRLT